MLIKNEGVLDVYEQSSEVAIERVAHPLSTGGDLDMIYSERLPFSLEEFVRRYELICEDIKDRGLDALLIRSPENLTYFSGYESPGYYKYHCIVVVPGQDPIFLVRDFEWLNVPEFSWITKIVKVYDWESPPELTAQILLDLGLSGKRVGVEKKGWFYTVEEHEIISAQSGAELIDATQILRDARMIKSSEEINVMKRSAEIVDSAMLAGYAATREGASGDYINAIVNKTLFEEGGEYMGLPPFVLAGDRSCVPHATGGANCLKRDDVMYFEISASHKRYCAALMRTIFVGKPKDEWLRAAAACISSVEAAMAFIKPGVTPHEADTVARAVTTEAGFSEQHRNRLGYSIGVNYPPDWGEGEIIDLRQEEYRPLQVGMTFHMPPLCLKWREYGIGFSESIVVTENGCERFSSLPREIIVR